MAVLSLDDTDSSITYSSGWGRAGSSNEYNSTTSSTVIAGTSARLSFRGTSVGVYGTIGRRGRASVAPVSTYSIDGGVPVTFTATQTARVQYTQLFFQSPVIANGLHTLTIAHPNRTDPLFLDFLLVVVPSDATVTPPAASSSTSTSTSTSTTSNTIPAPVTVTVTAAPKTTSIGTPTGAGANVQSSPSPSPTILNANTGATSSSNAAAVAGGVIAGIVALFLIVLGFIFWRRRRGGYRGAGRSRSIVSSFWNRPPPPTPPPEPFVLGNPPAKRVMTQSSPDPSNTYLSQWASTGRYGQSIPPGPSYASPAPRANYPFTSSTEVASYGEPQAPYPSAAYLPPSQLMNQSNDYNRGMPYPAGYSN